MDGLARGAANRAHWKRLGRLLGRAVVAGGDALLDNLGLAVEARRAALDQRHIGRQAHAIDVSPCIEIVERVEDNLEVAEPRNVELGVFDVAVVRDDFDVRIESAGSFRRNLRLLAFLSGSPVMKSYQSLGLFNVFVSKEELSVQVRKVNGVEVDDVNFRKTSQDEVLEQLTANAASADEQNTSLVQLSASSVQFPCALMARDK